MSLKQEWDVLIVSEDSITLNGVCIEPGDFCTAEDSLTGLLLEVRHTPTVGQHVVVSSCDLLPKYLYTMRCNTEGVYYLGPTHGYRKKTPDEEPCPVLKALRAWNLSTSILVRNTGEPLLLRRSVPEVPCPPGHRFAYYDSDARQVTEIDRRFGRITDSLQDYSYVIEVLEEYESLECGGVRIFKWLSAIYLNNTATPEQLTEIADKVKRLMRQNKQQQHEVQQRKKGKNNERGREQNSKQGLRRNNNDCGSSWELRGPRGHSGHYHGERKTIEC